MLSFEQFLIEGLLVTRVKDKKFLIPARQALKNIGFPFQDAQFNILNRRENEDIDFAKILTNRVSYGVTTKNVYVVGLPKTLYTGEDKQNRHCAVYKIPPTRGNTALYKLIPVPGSNRAQTKSILEKNVKEELKQWERFLVVTSFGAEQKQDQQTQNQNQKSATDSTDKVKSGSVDPGEYVNSFCDRVAKIPDYQLMACYVSKNDGKPHVQVKAGKYDIGLAFVDFNEPIAKNGKLAFRCQTLTPKSFLKTLDTSNLFTKAKSFLGITTTDVDKYRSSAVVIGEAFKDIVSAMQGSAEVAQILSEIEINKLPVK